jgi:hypothetical protein
MALTPTTTESDTRPLLDEGDGGDHDRFSHIVRKSLLTRAMVDGLPIEALCGKKWVPSRDPQRYPVCPTCLDLYARGRRP